MHTFVAFCHEAQVYVMTLGDSILAHSAPYWLRMLAGAYRVLWRCRGTFVLPDHDQSHSGLREMKTLVKELMLFLIFTRSSTFYAALCAARIKFTYTLLVQVHLHPKCDVDFSKSGNAKKWKCWHRYKCQYPYFVKRELLPQRRYFVNGHSSVNDQNYTARQQRGSRLAC